MSTRPGSDEETTFALRGRSPVTKRKPFLVGIVGGTASGKTSVSRKLCAALAPNAILLDMDSYYRDLGDLPFEERRVFNFDHPDAFDFPLLQKQLDMLLQGKAIEKPIYSFVEHTRTKQTTRIGPKPVIVLEGILAFNDPGIRQRCEMKLYVDTADDVRLARRLIRDIHERGRSFETVIEQYMGSVRPMHHGFVEPQKRFADIIIPHGGDNTVAIEMITNDLRSRMKKKTPLTPRAAKS
jgi:uridine kinase